MANPELFPNESTERTVVPRFAYGLVITFADIRDPDGARMLGIPKAVHSLPALVLHTLVCIWRHRNLLRGRG